MQTEPIYGYGLCECGCGERTSIARQSNRKFGHVQGRPVRFRPGHNTRGGPIEYEARDCGFDTQCWVWLRSVKSSGYGQAVDPDGRHRNAHSAVWERFHGPVPAGLELDHLCRNQLCVNPAHLEPVTHTENVQRGARAQLTVEQVRDIRRSQESALVLAERHGVSRRAIYNVRDGSTWKGIT